MEIEKNIVFIINECTCVTKMVKKMKEYILVFSPFLSLEPERKEEERSLGIMMFTSFEVREICTRRVMNGKVKNTRHQLR